MDDSTRRKRELVRRASSFRVDDKESRAYRLCRVVELLFVVVLILIAWGLLSLPAIFFYLPDQTTSNSRMGTGAPSGMSNQTSPVSNLDCLQANSSGGRCDVHLLEILSDFNCSCEVVESVLTDGKGQQQVNVTFALLNAYAIGDSCLEELAPFACQHVYASSSTHGAFVRPTVGQCEELRDSLCQLEWVQLVQGGVVPSNCSALSLAPASCEALQARPPFMVGNCSEGFYRMNGTPFCVASCYEWVQYDYVTTVVIDVWIALSGIVAFIGAIAVLVLSVLQYKKVLKFPSIFLVYMVLDALAFGVLMIVSYSHRFGLFCSDRSVARSFLHVTPFCALSGMTFNYIIFQMVVWWVIHTFILFWILVFPFHSKSYLSSKKRHWIHAVCIVIGLLVPLATVITTISKHASDSAKQANNETSGVDLFESGGLGYFNPRYPPVACINSDQNVAFYSLILPMCLFIGTGATLMVVIIWYLHRHSLSKSLAPKKLAFGTPEKKLLVVFCYFTILCSLALTTLTLRTRYGSNYMESVQEYFTCELFGHVGGPCSKSDIRRYSFPIVGTISFIVLGLYPIVALFYVVNVKTLKELCTRKPRDTRHSLFAMSSRVSQMSFPQKSGFL